LKENDTTKIKSLVPITNILHQIKSKFNDLCLLDMKRGTTIPNSCWLGFTDKTTSMCMRGATEMQLGKVPILNGGLGVGIGA
jgi:hypothetical protein